MRRTHLIAAITLLGAGLAGTPTFAAENGGESQSGQHLINSAVHTVNEIEADGRYKHMLGNCKGVFIMPDLVKGAFLVGGEGAQGVLLQHNSDGSWSQPAFMTIGSISVGAEAGGEAGPAAMILMTNKAVNDFTQANNFSLNGNAGLTVIGYSAKGQAPVGKGDIDLWSDQSGLFGGASVSGADLTQNTAEDHAYYGQNASVQKILGGNVTNHGASKLDGALPT